MSKTPWLLMVAPLAVLLSLAGCSDEKGAAACAAPTASQPRAPEGDSLCANLEMCSTGGQPDHQGCPNTCNCLCHEGRCYQDKCTAIGQCTAPAVYR